MYVGVLHKLTYSFNKHLQNTMYVPGTTYNEENNLVFTLKKLQSTGRVVQGMVNLKCENCDKYYHIGDDDSG